jgi:hypothetical protein
MKARAAHTKKTIVKRRPAAISTAKRKSHPIVREMWERMSSDMNEPGIE